MSEIINFNQVTKKYKAFNNNKSFRNNISEIFNSIFYNKTKSKNEYIALDNISFSLPRGTTLGLIGSNGSGKSTLLKLITRVTYPSEGLIKINGNVASLLEVGAGFHIEFTGRENIYLNGALLGLTRKQIEQKFDEIVEFSELRQFIDTPIKKYSSGMFVKLGFAVAIHVNPEILLVDEVLSVGDANFQNKCIKKMREIVSDSEKTVIIVSHNMVTIQALCDKVLWLEKGKLRALGETNQIISMYSEEINKRSFVDSNDSLRDNSSDIYSVEINLTDSNQQKKNKFTDETVFVELIYKINKELDEEPMIQIYIEAVDLGLPIASLSSYQKTNISQKTGEHKLNFSFKVTNIYPRECTLRVNITSKDMLNHYDTWYDACRFYVVDETITNNLGVSDIIKIDHTFY